MAAHTIDDPEFRRARASKAGYASHSTDVYIDRIVARAPTLTADQIDRLRDLLPEAGGDDG